MANSIGYARGSLILALLFAGMSSFLGAAGYFMLPAQEIETKAELKQSQATGLPNSDDDINTHLGRLASSRRVYGVTCGLTVLSGAGILAALILLSRNGT